MPAEYDPIVRQYRRSKELPFRLYSEIPDHLALLGDLTDRSVLDVACGEGFYTRLIRQAGATRAVGVDVSAGMIALARQQEVECPLSIDYVQISAERMPELGPFDLVSAAYLLNTAPDERSLAEMARSLAANLKQGGRLVVTHGDLCRFPGVDYSPYGMATEIPAPLAEGAPYRITFLLEENTFTITDFAWSRGAIEQALSAAGFEAFRWLLPEISPEGIARYGEQFWKTYRELPPILRLEAKRVVRG